MAYYGDIAPSAIIDFKFTTKSPSTGAPATLSGTPAVSVYKDNSTTQSTAGITLSVDFDSVTGLNSLRVDTSADGTFYAAGSNFTAVVTTGTVGGASAVGYVLGDFSIFNRSFLRPTTQGRTLDVSSGGEAGVDWANVGSPTTTLNLSGTSTLALEPTTAGRKLDVTTTGEAGIDWANIGAPTTAQNLSGTSTKALEPTVAGRTLDVTATGEGGIDWANVGAPTTTLNLSGTTIATSQVVASVTGAVGSVTGAVGSVTGAVGSVSGNVGGNVTGSVGSVVGAVGSVTGNVGGNVTGTVASVVGNVGGNVTGSVGSVSGNVGGNVVGSVGSVTAPVTAGTVSDKTGYALSSAGNNAAADALLIRTDGVETGFTMQDALRLMLSSVAAKLSGAATTTVSIRDVNDTKDRIVATVDADGNRTATTYDVS